MKRKTLPQLISLVKNHDEDAFNELYDRYYKLVRYIAFGLTNNYADTDEIVQEVFVQVQKSIDDLKDPNGFKAWLSKITYSKAKMLFRKNKDFYMSEEYLDLLQNKEEKRNEYLPYQKNRHQSDLDVLYTCIQKLKPHYREMLILYYFSELNIREISDLTKLPEGTVKSRLLYAKKYLRIEIENYEKQSGEAITFQGKTLEAALFALGARLIKEPKIKGFSFYRFTIPTSTVLIMAEFALVGVLGFGTVCGINQFLLEPKSHDNSTKEVEERPEDQKRFPMIIYRNQRITTAREAYATLIDFADCDVEMREKTETEIKEIDKVYSALMDYGEGYAQLLQRRNWDKIFEKYK